MLMSLTDRNQSENVKVDFPFLHMHYHIELMLRKSLLCVIYTLGLACSFSPMVLPCA